MPQFRYENLSLAGEWTQWTEYDQVEVDGAVVIFSAAKIEGDDCRAQWLIPSDRVTEIRPSRLAA